MVRDSKVAPAAHQPSKAELEEDVSVDATPEALAWAVTRGGAERRDRHQVTSPRNEPKGLIPED